MADDVELEELRMLRQLAMATAADTERTAAALSSGPILIHKDDLRLIKLNLT